MTDEELFEELLGRMKENGHDVRVLRDDSRGTLSFQGCINLKQEETDDES
jgi:hypothetical protein